MTRLPAVPLAARPGRHDLCLRFAQHGLEPPVDEGHVVVEGQVEPTAHDGQPGIADLRERAGERLRVTAQLIDVASGELLWSDRIDTAASDIIVLQDTIAHRIVEGLRVELSPAEQVGIGSGTGMGPTLFGLQLTPSLSLSISPNKTLPGLSVPLNLRIRGGASPGSPSAGVLPVK